VSWRIGSWAVGDGGDHAIVSGRVDVSTGKVIGRLHARHRAIEFKQFPATLDREVPADLDVHVILDNSSTHKTPAIRKWLTAHPRFALALHAHRQLVAQPRRALSPG